MRKLTLYGVLPVSVGNHRLWRAWDLQIFGFVFYHTLISSSFNSFPYFTTFLLLPLLSVPVKHNTHTHVQHQQQPKLLLIQLIETKCPSSLQCYISHVFLFPTDLRISLLELIFFSVPSTPSPKRL